jgi:cation diffusion facilitator CzcD-associated flavoprotein CzcO
VTQRCHDVVIVGAGSVAQHAAAELRDGGATDFAIVDREVIGTVFDDATDIWTLAVPGGEACRARVVIACESPFVPWIPKLPGCNDFRGDSFHAAAPNPDFDPAAKRIAMIGSDSTAGSFIARLTRSAASVTVFPLSPRRAIPQTRRAGRYPRRRRVEVVASPIDTVTASGIRTADGAHHLVDAIVYGTGLTVADRDESIVGTRGLSLCQAWRDGMEPYLGVAIHGFPNYFLAGGPDPKAVLRYIGMCLRLMETHRRIEVRRSSQQVFNERAYLRGPRYRMVTSAFDLVSPIGVYDDIYDGAATLTVAGTHRAVRVRLTGHVDPIDGQYHWQGTLFSQLSADALGSARTVTLAVGERTVSARISEETPQGTYSIAGVGTPPFALAEVELTVPQR